MGSGRNITVRTAMVADAPRLTQLMRQAFEDAYAAHIRHEDLEAHMDANFTEARQQAELLDPRVITLVASAGNAPAGYAQLVAGPVPDCVKTERPVQLLRFYLLKPFWGSGAADKLMQRCLARLSNSGCTEVWLSTWEKNMRARAFYQKWGFRPIGSAPFLVGNDRQTDSIMSRPIFPDHQ